MKSELVAWSIWKPVWLLALFVQLRLIWLEEAAVAVRPLGAAGMPTGVVTVRVALSNEAQVLVNKSGPSDSESVWPKLYAPSAIWDAIAWSVMLSPLVGAVHVAVRVYHWPAAAACSGLR